ncbi:hypothetical protein MKX03_014392 [Papaver bracteatum]|nr:hypothetical protein MKX03_014392 [Papaver bracteatum]
MKKYVPPHKRHLKDGAKALEGSSLNSHSLAHKLNLSGSFSSDPYPSERAMRKDKVASFGGRYAYAKSFLSRLCIVDSTEREDQQYSGSITLEHISLESILYKKHGRTPYVLVSSHKKTGTNELNKNSSSVENPLISVAEQILPNLLAFQNKSVEGNSKEFEEGKICFVARFGKVLFHGIPSLAVDTLLDKSRYEASLSRIFRSFNTNVPRSFTESVLNVVVPGIGVDFDQEKEYYYVRVADKSFPDVSLSCKCTAAGVGGIELQKIETNNVRHVMVDAACVERDLDLRLMLFTRKIITEHAEEAKHDLETLIKSAVVDGNEKGGLRFPLGNSKGRYRVVGIGHTITRAFKNSSIRVKLHEADRYDFVTSTAEVTNQVVLKMTGISKKLKANNLESDQLEKMLEDNMKLIWNYFLSLECCFA